jgi:hypothetical protein
LTEATGQAEPSLVREQPLSEQKCGISPDRG